MDDTPADTATPPFPFDGDPTLAAPITAALRDVVDPESALSIVDMGLVVGVTVDAQRVHVRLVMTSAACPVADLIVGETEQALDRVVPPERLIQVEVQAEPAWTPERMTAQGRRFMRW